MSHKYSVLFVCLGNICRSPAAQAIFEKIAKQNAPQFSFHVDSAAVGKWSVGEPPDPRSVLACHKKGYEIDTSNRARLITAQDYTAHNYIFAVEDSIHKKILRLAPKKVTSNVELLTKYSDKYLNEDIPDPYYGSEEAFDASIMMIEDACIGIVEYFLKLNAKSQ